METVSRAAVVARLLADNPEARADDLHWYAEAYCEYIIATKNIEEHGTIVLHPKTNAPMENPYLKIRSQSVEAMRKVLVGNRLLKHVEALWPL